MINTDRVGFYRVDYDEYSQNLITQELNSGYTVRNPFIHNAFNTEGN